MDIGETLAQARQEAGLTVTQVAERTRIRETVIRAIERDDFTLCGGNFYARGHIRGIARVIGADAEGLVQAYDETHGGAPAAIPATMAFQPEKALKLRERRAPNWTAAMAVALALVLVYVVVRVISGQSSGHDLTTASHRSAPSQNSSLPPASRQPVPQSAVAPKGVALQLTAVSSTWVNVKDDQGKVLFSGLVKHGLTRNWTDAKKLKITIGDCGGVRLTVNGKDLGAPGADGAVQTFTFVPGDPVGA